MTTSVIVVYTKPECVQCEYTKKKLDEYGVCYTEIDITLDVDGRDYLISKGVRTVPFVKTDTDEWIGYRHEKIRGLKPVDRQ